MQSQESSSSCYQEQFRQPSIEEQFLTLKEEFKKDKDTLEMWFPIMETKMDAKMITDMVTNLKNLSKEMCSIMERTGIQVEELAKILKEQSSRQLLSKIQNNDIQKCESITLRLEDELSSLTSNEDKDIMECDKMPLVLEGEFQVPSLVEKNEFAIEEESSLKVMQVEKKHLEHIIENVLVGVKDFNFPIDPLTFGMEEDRQVSFIEKSSIATSQVWIYVEHGEMTLFFGEEKMKFDIHQSILLSDDEMRACMKIES